MRLSEIALEEARADLEALTLRAPFDGVIASVDVRPGDRGGAGADAITLSTERILVELTVTETDLPAIEIGQVGLATFDALEGGQYPLRIVSVSRVPNAQQGVVTYEVRARLLRGAEVAEVTAELAALGGAGAGFGGFAGLGGGAARDLLAGLELPEGVTLQQIVEALASGGELPEGVTLPEGLQIPPQLLERLSAGLGGARARGGAEAAAGVQPLPAPGMSGSITLLTEVRAPAVLLPVGAVRQIDGAWFVAVPAPEGAGGDEGPAPFERVEVEVGASDGTLVEITSGLAEGTVVLLGADSEGVPYSATRLPQQAPGGFEGVFPDRGGGGGR